MLTMAPLNIQNDDTHGGLASADVRVGPRHACHHDGSGPRMVSSWPAGGPRSPRRRNAAARRGAKAAATDSECRWRSDSRRSITGYSERLLSRHSGWRRAQSRARRQAVIMATSSWSRGRAGGHVTVRRRLRRRSHDSETRSLVPGPAGVQ